MQAGFIGLGRMGSGMATNLIKAGHDVVVFNRTSSKADALVALGAKAADTIAQACRGPVAITMLANDDAVEEVVFGKDGILASLGKGAIHVSSSTISVALSDRLTEAHAVAGQRFVAAPVFGRPDAAAARQLFVAAAGEEKAIGEIMPLLHAIGQRVFLFSEKPSIANLVKLSGNFLLGSVIEALGEAIALVSKAGVDRRQYVDFLTSTLFDAPAYKVYGPMIASDAAGPVGFAAHLGFKDIKLALAAGEELRVPLPLASLLRDRFLSLFASGGKDLDWSAVGKLSMRDSGQSANGNQEVDQRPN